jgi:hypothetical protein
LQTPANGQKGLRFAAVALPFGLSKYGQNMAQSGLGCKKMIKTHFLLCQGAADSS